MNISNLDDLEKSINRIVWMSLIFFFFVSLGALKIIDNRMRSISDVERIDAASNSLFTNLNKQIYLIAASAFFSDYMRSGELSRNRHESYFLQRISLVEPNLIKGNKFTEHPNKIILEDGEPSPYYITYQLCYLDEQLDEKYGHCHYQWTVYLSKKGLTSALNEINPDIAGCSNCELRKVFHAPAPFYDLPIIAMSPIKIPIHVKEKNTMFEYLFVLVFVSCLIGFACWSGYRIKRNFKKTIAGPLENMTKKLHSNEPLEENNQHIIELQYLSKQINAWQKRTSEIQEKEKEITYGKCAARIVHDIRSPIATLRIMFDQLTAVPEQHLAILKKAIDSISDITNQLLSKYNKQIQIEEEESVGLVDAMIEGILSEKKIQYPLVKFEYLNKSDEMFHVKLQPQTFGRILSNIINNAIEASDHQSTIYITLSQEKSKIEIEILDNGCGIPPHILPCILQQPVSYGKKYGHGLGLSHARKSINAWGGDIEIDSREFQYTRVVITLPLFIYY